jgi:hypothetical protein
MFEKVQRAWARGEVAEDAENPCGDHGYHTRFGSRYIGRTMSVSEVVCAEWGRSLMWCGESSDSEKIGAFPVLGALWHCGPVSVLAGAAKLLDGAGNLLSPATIQSLQTILAGAAQLLSADNVKALSGVIGDVGPVRVAHRVFSNARN